MVFRIALVVAFVASEQRKTPANVAAFSAADQKLNYFGIHEKSDALPDVAAVAISMLGRGLLRAS